MVEKKDAKNKGMGRGWHGDPEGHARAGAIGGKAWKKPPKRKKKNNVDSKTSQ